MIPNNNLTCYYIPKKILTQDEYNSIPSEYDFLKDIQSFLPFDNVH